MQITPKVAFYTLGCKVNQYDTQSLRDMFLNEGYQIVDFDEYADIYIINTCVVTHIAERKSRQNIRKAKKKNPLSTVAVVGCYPQTFPEKVKELGEVDVFLGTEDRKTIMNLIKKVKKEDTKEDIINNEIIDSSNVKRKFNKYDSVYDDVGINNFDLQKEQKSRHFLKVQEGCERYCSYCIVPYARGKIKSRPITSVLKEAKEAVNSGFKEIVLTGSNLGAYGDESFYKPDLVDLIRALTSLNFDFRVRLSSIEPMEISQELINELSTNPKICPHLHIPLQSADDQILKKMNRPYTGKDFKKLIFNIKELIPDISLTTDVIVGFPGENKKHFERTKAFIKKIGFMDLHVFKYSVREKTPAANYADQVQHELKEKRSAELIKLSKELKFEYQKRFLGRNLKALIETREGNYYSGLTENYLKVYLHQNEIDKNGYVKGEFCDIKLYLINDKVIAKIIK
ncbi:tRNA (N(6)-L-threonylcarbamoyladenosine(37)-C(2))-methylthiotransferase MtaB [Natranaerofaba carboxydovora]|uniref:tRNA (N(6)-L-threonylcarbamoyladenosine(37)-C(2))- methylthiotransferase MtaB n=1 Tax=Natranaerofaba carboxydovora TaxID=2742683 RepID=UPI001F13AA6A|nr:tRNA (N(6)-L-threonylcarbamoyladenosine(37)-C(2))-methylthiotransferase MtaB [Natranaerofaba carboxydovora]UMZ73076.1 Threonylcarbamoyladenosine tRNA methylthiotransferase MtaB [Natranaerofaba carboxydovora]